MDYQEIKLNKFRNVISFSFCFITFFGGEIHFTKEIFGWCIIRQRKIKYKTVWFDEWDYRSYWTPWKYKWITIKIE